MRCSIRVSGEFGDFEHDGPDFFEYIKNDHENKLCLKIDFTIPESRWKGVTKDEIKLYFVRGFIKCTQVLIAEAEKMKECIAQEQFWNDYRQAIGCFLLDEDSQADEPTRHYDTETIAEVFRRFQIDCP